MDTVNASPGPDLIDSVVGLTPEDGLYAIRQGREKVRAATQGSYDLFFDPAAGNLTIQERLLVAYYACVLSRAHALAQHYYGALLQNKVDVALIQHVSENQLEQIQSERLKALLVFTQKLIEKPVEGDQAAIQALQLAGVSTPDIVTLAQLIAFLSYQLRLVAGLQALKALESQT
ncbi:CMD domain protein [Candidimonas sp. SYP-B2681]|uniref:CMD domain protein n=1 Tax=Candidimonas sp. SYP-B2681 TaxID=2497686 RepID=UPI000F8821E4|nr:CMD domain protein [Candidimonas sp. SYP-B2681]RTZ45604.1 CMD domain protein [Candidimonas sp. SYP-B2681]